MHKDMYVRHAFINHLHHYLVMWYDDETYTWEIGIAAQGSKRKAYRMASGMYGKWEKIATTTNHRVGVRPAWFITQLNDVLAQLRYDARYVPQYVCATAVDTQRHSIYKHMLRKRGWTQTDTCVMSRWV